ncbi:unnamed protein product [Clavelina lepadiformis]|uniref:Fibrinogen C-terminal domain-containing protein n=1 Tax=Clavelina lepadiformis TaxID=159417 RepID=A0ABP0F5H5_CLALP
MINIGLVWVVVIALTQKTHAQQCSRYVTVCEDGLTSNIPNSVAVKGEKGEIGFPGKSGPRGEEVKGDKGDIGVKGAKGDAASPLDDFMAEVRERLSQLEEKMVSSCSMSTTSGKKLLSPLEEAYCDDGWRIVQRRFDGSVNFNREWISYKFGFGDVSSEFWIGLEKLHQMTRNGGCMLRIDLEDFNGEKRYAEYRNFKVNDEHDLYRLLVSGYSGDAGDSMEYHNNMYFTTRDRDNDRHGSNCASSYSNREGGWWYNSCFYSSLNAPWGEIAGNAANIQWWHWKGHGEALKAASMKVRCSSTPA